MQQDADFITALFLYMFRASSAHHQEYNILMLDARNMYRKPAVIKSASCCIMSLFYLTLYCDAREHNIKKFVLGIFLEHIINLLVVVLLVIVVLVVAVVVLLLVVVIVVVAVVVLVFVVVVLVAVT
jgi:hypothetical protein